MILVEKTYNSAIDIWSTGCILSEMISCTEQYKANGVNPQDRFLFTGTSCFPLSPCEKMKNSGSQKRNIVSKNDQLKMILEILGDQDSMDTSFVSDQSALDYINTLRPNTCKIEFKKEFPFTTPEILDILQSMLEFNPNFRGTAAELLKSKVFDKIRKPEMEVSAPFQIKLAIDEAGAFDYDKCKSDRFSIEDYKKMLVSEIKTIKQMDVFSK